MKIKTKLILLVSFLVLSLFITGFLAVFQSAQTDKIYRDIENQQSLQLTLKSIQYRFTGISNDERGYLLTGDKKFLSGIDSKIKDIEHYFSEANNLQLNPSDKKVLENINNSLQTYFEKNKQMADAYQDGDVSKAQEIHMLEQRDLRKGLVDPSVENVIDQVTKTIDEDTNLLEKTQQISSAILYLTIALSVIGGMIVSSLIIRSINKPIKKMNVRLKEIAEGEGDLTQGIFIKTRDELGEMASSFNLMVGKLRELIKSVASSAEQVAAASEQLSASAEETTKSTELIASTVQEVAAGADKQVQNLNETNVTVTHLTSLVNQVVERAEIVSSTSVQASDKAVDGNQSISNIIYHMDEINVTVNRLADKVRTLGDRSSQINQIIGVITGIANQTNLLALNAAIEAARAGEHGKGFAVVADEVRKLAEQSSNSAQQIAALISDIETDTAETVYTMNDTTNKVSDGIGLIQEAGSAFQLIEKAVQEVSFQIQEVKSAIHELSAGSAQVEKGVEIVAAISNGTAGGTQSISASAEEQLAAMEEITASSTSLTRMAEELQDLIKKFKY